MPYRRMIRASKVAAGTLAGLLALAALATVAGDVLIGRANPPVGRFVDTTAGRQHVVDLAPDAGTTAPGTAVVLLHGTYANVGDMLLALGTPLRARHRVIAIDRPGNGWSERRDGAADAAPARQAAIVHEILGKLDVERAVLVGHSWGGAVAAAYALEYPDELSGLVLLAPASHPRGAALPGYFALANERWLVPLLAYTVALPLGYIELDRLVRFVFSPQSPPPDYIERASIRLALRPGAIIANSDDLARLDGFIAPQAARYPQIKTRTVIITGAADGIVPPRVHARALAAQVRGADLIVLPGVGHMPHHAAPERIVAAIDVLANADGNARSSR